MYTYRFGMGETFVHPQKHEFGKFLSFECSQVSCGLVIDQSFDRIRVLNDSEAGGIYRTHIGVRTYD